MHWRFRGPVLHSFCQISSKLKGGLAAALLRLTCFKKSPSSEKKSHEPLSSSAPFTMLWKLKSQQPDKSSRCLDGIQIAAYSLPTVRMAHSWCPCCCCLPPPLTYRFHLHLFCLIHTSSRFACSWNLFVGALFKGWFCIDKHNSLTKSLQLVQSSVQCLSALVKLCAEMGDIFTAVSKFIMASTAFVATASIWLFL